jgi:REP element-mobilizing transposase RayT
VTTVGAGRCAIFVDDLDRLNFADCFWQAVLDFDLRCIVACQVGTHYHAVFEAEREVLSNAMRKLNGSYAGRFNLRHNRRGHLFGARFSGWVIESDAHLELTVPYVLWNPVRAGLCDSPEEWQWSWLEPARATTVSPGLARATGRDCPMGQSLRRVRERRRRERLKRRRVGAGREK